MTGTYVYVGWDAGRGGNWHMFNLVHCSGQICAIDCDRLLCRVLTCSEHTIEAVDVMGAPVGREFGWTTETANCSGANLRRCFTSVKG